MFQKTYLKQRNIQTEVRCLWYWPVMVGVVHEQPVMLPCSQTGEKAWKTVYVTA